MNITNVLLKVIICISISLTLYACSSDGGSSGNALELREIDISGENVLTTDVESYFSPNQYGPTQKIYNIQGESSVVILRISNESEDFEMSVTIYLFDSNLENESIRKWINNQYSDGLYGDAPMPIDSYELSSEQYSIASSNLIDQTVGRYGDEYDNYSLEIYVDDVSEAGVYNLKSFVADVVVHVQTKEIDREERSYIINMN